MCTQLAIGPLSCILSWTERWVAVKQLLSGFRIHQSEDNVIHFEDKQCGAAVQEDVTRSLGFHHQREGKAHQSSREPKFYEKHGVEKPSQAASDAGSGSSNAVGHIYNKREL